MVWQDTWSCTPPDAAVTGRIFIGVRGDTSLSWVDVKSDPSLTRPTLSCSEQTGALAECTNKLVDMTSNLDSAQGDTNPPSVGLPDEPYALAIDQDFGLLYVGHLVGTTTVADSGGISMFDVTGAQPAFIGPFSSPFPANSAGNFGVTAINLHPSYTGGGSGHEFYVSSRYVPLVSSMAPFVPGSADLLRQQFLCGYGADLVALPAGDTLSSGLTGSEMRGVEFLDPTTPGTPQQAFALQRVPPDLVTFNITATEGGGIVPVVSSVTETCSSPTFLYKHQIGNSTRLYVSCFDTGEIYVFDVNGPSLITSLQAARGPAGMVFDPLRPVAYVLDFSHNDVAVVDLTPGSPTEDHVIQRLGFPSISPR
jgi:hypothetical protein